MRRWALTLLLLSAGCGDGDRADGAHRTLKMPIRSSAATAEPTVPAVDEVAPAAEADIAHNEAKAAPAALATPPKLTGALPAVRVDNSYYAVGTEPFWTVTVRGSSASIDRADKEPARVIVSRVEEGGGVRYIGDGFNMTVTAGPCSDGMSDAIWSDHVALSYGGDAIKGCGGRRDDPSD